MGTRHRVLKADSRIELEALLDDQAQLGWTLEAAYAVSAFGVGSQPTHYVILTKRDTSDGKE